MHWKPDHYQGLIPYLTVGDAAAALDFYTRAFGAEETSRLRDDGRVMHAEMKLAECIFMLSGEWPDIGCRTPRALGGTSTLLVVYVSDADAAYARAVEGGAESEHAPRDEFYGDRVAAVRDPWGHRWSFHTHQRTMTEADVEAAMAASRP